MVVESERVFKKYFRYRCQPVREGGFRRDRALTLLLEHEGGNDPIHRMTHHRKNLVKEAYRDISRERFSGNVLWRASGPAFSLWLSKMKAIQKGDWAKVMLDIKVNGDSCAFRYMRKIYQLCTGFKKRHCPKIPQQCPMRAPSNYSAGKRDQRSIWRFRVMRGKALSAQDGIQADTCGIGLAGCVKEGERKVV